jgi:hypothetical protein
MVNTRILSNGWCFLLVFIKSHDVSLIMKAKKCNVYNFTIKTETKFRCYHNLLTEEIFFATKVYKVNIEMHFFGSYSTSDEDLFNIISISYVFPFRRSSIDRHWQKHVIDSLNWMTNLLGDEGESRKKTIHCRYFFRSLAHQTHASCNSLGFNHLFCTRNRFTNLILLIKIFHTTNIF